MKRLVLGSALAAVLSLAAIAPTLAHATTTCSGLFANAAVALGLCSANSYQLVVPPGATVEVLTQTATPPPTSTATPTNTPSPTATNTATETATSTATPTNTATSTPSPTPTATPLMAQIAPGGSALITCENGDAPTVMVSGPTAQIDCLAASPTPTWTATATPTPPTPVAALGTPESVYALANTNAAPIDVSQTYSNGYQSTVVIPAQSTVLVHLASVTAVPTNWSGTVQLSSTNAFSAGIAGFDYR